MEKTYHLEGNAEQCSELLRAVETLKTVLMQMGGDSAPMDAVIEKRLSRLSFWQETLISKLT